MPQFKRLKLDGVIEVIPNKHPDERGFFSEVWNESIWTEGGIRSCFVQDNHSFSEKAGTLRGLHYQLPPFGQSKLVRVIQGAVFDVAVDIRKHSPSFGKWLGIEISAAKWNQLFIPEGFAHGFVTLEPNTQLLYKVSGRYSRDHDRAIRFDDPDIGIDWTRDLASVILSEKDRSAPSLVHARTEFDQQFQD
jgi:dTDP-4-dehydrorhamnose 3,5-epimerase